MRAHQGSRELYLRDFFCTAQEAGAKFLLRTCVDRRAGDGEHTIATQLAAIKCKRLHRIEVRDRHGNVSEAVLELKCRRIQVQPSLYKQHRYPALELTVLHATERGKPRGRDRIDWKLITNLPVILRAQAIEKLQWYTLRWRIKVFHKILKSGCQAEQSNLRTAERLVNLLATFCILSWRIFWLTMTNRSTQNAKASLAFTPLEIDILNRLALESQSGSPRSPKLKNCLTQLARLGGYLDRAGDGPPGNLVMWRGMSRLTDIENGFMMTSEKMGN